MPRLPAQEVFLLIKELGLPDVPELLAATDIGSLPLFSTLIAGDDDSSTP